MYSRHPFSYGGLGHTNKVDKECDRPAVCPLGRLTVVAVAGGN